MPRAVLLSALVLLLLLPAGAGAAPRCAARHGEHVRAHGPLLTVLEATSATRDVTTVTLRSCDPRTGRRRPLTSASSGWGYLAELRSVRVAGHRVAVLIATSDKYMSSSTELALFDVRTGFRAEPVAPMDGVTSWDLGPGFQVAMARYGRVEVWRPLVDDLRVLARGRGFSSVTVSNGLIRWSHGPRRTAAPLALGASACPPGLRRGTREVDLLAGGVCWRATGAVTAFGDGEEHQEVTGPFVATRTAGAVLRRDARDPAATPLVIPFAGAEAVAVSLSGNLVWRRAAGATSELWVHDGEDTHRIGDVGAAAPFALDGETVTWPPGYAYVLRVSSR
jgi:hypothetical protein